MKVTPVEKSELPSYLPLPLFSTQVAAGFPSPADDYIESGLDLNEYLIRSPSSTYLVRASGDSMTGCGIQDGALLVVDRSITPRQGHIVIAAVNGELTCKLLDIKGRQLLAGNGAYAPIPITEEADLSIEGVVVHAINSLCPPG